MRTQTSDFHRWFGERRLAVEYQVTPTALDRLDGWILDPDTGELRHHSGRFFTIAGLQVRASHREVESWAQPIIHRPETGVLGILVRRFGEEPHLLLQAKMEPGNINLVQLSPTVQATRSNYTRVHRGRAVPYLEYFIGPRRGRVRFDVLQSEQGSWFLCKRNRNMIVEVAEDVPVRTGFRWVSLHEIGELLAVDNLVNMDTRTVLSGLPWPGTPGGPALHDLAELMSWFTGAKAGRVLERSRIPLSQAKGWAGSAERISHESGRYFSVIGVDVRAADREIARWSQPMLAPSGRGVVAFLVKRIEGTPHLLVQARTEAGTLDVVEMAPTVQCAPGNHRHLPPGRRPAFLELVLDAPRSRVRIDVVHSEEGGRFYHAENRYLVVEVGDDVPVAEPPDFIWMTVEQLMTMVRFGNHVNVEARNLLADLRLIP